MNMHKFDSSVAVYILFYLFCFYLGLNYITFNFIKVMHSVVLCRTGNLTAPKIA